MRSVNRSGFDPVLHTPRGKDGEYLTPDKQPLPPIPLENVSTCNPYGPGHNWVKAEFIDAGPYAKVIVKQFNLYNPKTKREETVRRTQATLFGTFKENPFLSPEYIAGIMDDTDENLKKAWLAGDWDIISGGAFDDKWKKGIHVISRFKVPENWRIDRAFDWGSTHPFSVGWWTEANGEEVTLETGERICPQRGTLIQISEWYGSAKIGTNTGLRLSAKDIAKGIIEREKYMLEAGWIKTRPLPGPADNQIDNVNDVGTETIKKQMEDLGVYWETSDKSSGSRKQGLQLARDRLEASIRSEGAGLLFTENCNASIVLLPVLPRDERDMDDVDTAAEDHAWDQIRYRVLKGNDRTAKVIRLNFGAR